MRVTKEKQPHRLREETTGCQWEEGRQGGGRGKGRGRRGTNYRHVQSQ